MCMVITVPRTFEPLHFHLMKSTLLASFLLIAVLAGGSFSVNAQATGGVATVSNSQIGFIVANGIIYSVDSRGVATVLPASLRLSGTLQGINGFTQMIAVLKPGTMLTIDGKVVPAPVGLVLGSSIGTPVPAVTPVVVSPTSPTTTTVVNPNGSITTTTTNADGSTTTNVANPDGSMITTIVKADGTSTTTTTGASTGNGTTTGVNGTGGASVKSADTSGSGAAFKTVNPAGAGASVKTVNPAGSGAAFKTINPAGSGASFKSASPNGPGNPNGVGTGVKR